MIGNRHAQSIVMLTVSLLSQSFFVPLCRAEISLDGTVGPNGALAGPDFTIPAEVGRQVGSNLFHSFGQFNINIRESATFTGPNLIENILGRVTGGESSTINGLLRSEIPEANVFLINPAGIMFGPNAKLDVQGSFHASTADYIRLGENGRFDATQPDNSFLTIDPPTAFGFLSDNPAPISVQGSSLSNLPGETLSLVGGDIEISGGKFIFLDGTINIASVSSPGEVTPNIPEQFSNLSIDSYQEIGNIAVSDGAYISVYGEGGGIFIRGGTFSIEEGSQLSSSTGYYSQGQGADISINANNVTLKDGASIYSDTWGEGQGGEIEIQAENQILLSGSDKFSSICSTSWVDGEPGEIHIDASDLIIIGKGAIGGSTVGGEGISSNIYIGVKNFTLTGTEAKISSNTDSENSGGNISIDATGHIQIDGGQISSSTYGIGKGGGITINAADSISISNFGTISSWSYRPPYAYSEDYGDAGTITVFSPTLTMDNSLIGAGTNTDGDAGNILLAVNKLELTNGAQIETTSGLYFPSSGVIVGSGNAGSITVNAAESLSISGSNLLGYPSAIFSNDGGIVNQAGEQSIGSIDINTAQLFIVNQSKISTITVGDRTAGKITIASKEVTLEDGAKISSDSGEVVSEDLLLVGKGGAGTIDISTDSFSVSGKDTTISTNTYGAGDGGDIRITTQQVSLNNDAAISAQSLGIGQNSGRSGNIVLQADDSLKLNKGSRITVETEQADAGEIIVKARNLIYLLDSSEISTSVADGQGDGGNIDIDPVFVILKGESKIIANAREGSGGNITIHIDGEGSFIKSSDSIVNASSELGVNGSVTIKAPETDISAAISTLPVTFLDISSILSDRCVTRTSGDLSTFNLVGRGGMSLSPEFPLPAFYSLVSPKHKREKLAPP